MHTRSFIVAIYQPLRPIGPTLLENKIRKKQYLTFYKQFKCALKELAKGLIIYAN